MPAPGQQAPWQQAMPSALQKMWEQSEPDLASEISELRKEIAALRAELAPVPSLIVTGRQALDEFKRLAHAGPQRMNSQAGGFSPVLWNDGLAGTQLRRKETAVEQLILHMFGDYITQTDWMATNKTKRTAVAVLHAAVYSLPFLLLWPSMMALAVIFATHAAIDRYRLARFVVFAKNWTTQPSLKWADCSDTGYHKNTPAWLAVWLLIVADNAMHLAINYAALRWL